MRGVRNLGEATRKSLGLVVDKSKTGLAYYPLTFYFGACLIILAGFMYWAHFSLLWQFDFVQLKRWAVSHATELLITFSGLLGLIFIMSAIAYKQCVNLTQEDYNLWLHQRATRVFFPIFTPIHDWLRLKSRLYQWWHIQSISSVTHIALLIIAIGATADITFDSVASVQASHGCSDTVTITANTTWSTNQCHGAVTIRNGATLTINGGITADLSSLSVGSDSPAENGFLTVKGDTLNGTGVVLNVDGNVYVRTSSSISGVGQGFAGGACCSSNGSGPGGGVYNNGRGGGGAHGGNGGHGNSSGFTQSESTAYGDLNSPTTLGSGGGGGSSGAGGNGGSALKINAPTGTVTLNGNVDVSGAGGSGGCCGYSGGGAGGSLWIIADTMAGSGYVYANGGSAVDGSGAGAGGRIKITSNTDSGGFTGARTQALGSYTGNSNDYRGGAGTVITNTALYIANNGAINRTYIAATPITAATYSYTAFTARDYANVTFADNTTFAGGTTLIQNNSLVTFLGNSITWTGGALTIGGDSTTNTVSVRPGVSTAPSFSSITVGTGTLNHLANTSTDTYHLILGATGNVTVSGTINLDSKGYSGGDVHVNGNGPGAGLYPTGYGNGHGAGYGGAGGTGGSSATGSPGAAYGSLEAPTDLGSGGSGGYSNGCCEGAGGAGGGALKLTAGGTMTVSGSITATGGTGGSACCAHGGGGSGGGIHLITGTLSGSGSVTANGGAGGCYSSFCSPGGAGAGGRIRITYTTDSSTITTQAYGGISGNPSNSRAAAGTISTTGKLTIGNNPGNTSIASPITPLSGTLSYPAMDIKDAAVVTLASGANLSSGTTALKNVSKFTLLGNNTIWTGGAFTIGGDNTTNTLNVPKAITSEPSFSSITVGSGTFTHDAHTTTDTYRIILNASGNVTVSGTINLDGKGYSGGDVHANGNGPGAGLYATSYGNGHGAAYGGNGARSDASTGSAGVAYGSVNAPTDLGSGGSGGYANGCCEGNGGAGGGAVKITSGATMSVTGTITAGGNTGGSACCAHGAGGSGGSIYLITSTLSGNGSVTANGGVGGCYSSFCSPGGAGGGGRIRLSFTTDSSTISSTAYGGHSGNPGVSNRGGAGTIVKGSGTTLTIGNNPSNTSLASPLTPLSGTLSYSGFTIKDRANVTMASGANISGGTTTIENYATVTLLANDTTWSGGALTTQTGDNVINVPPGVTVKPLFSSINFSSGTIKHAANTTTDAYHLILTATGNITVGTAIDLTGLGFSGGTNFGNGYGPGAGTGSNGTGGGGGHGGNGGNGSSGGTGGSSYGDALYPVTLGSGGGSGAEYSCCANGGSGGGAVELVSGGTLAVNAAITVTGNGGTSGLYPQAGGGSGGSIALVGSTISGSGNLTANGGSGGNGVGGCGAGGRIVRHSSTSTYSGTVSVVKGGGTCGTGQNGTNQTVGAVTHFTVSGHSSPVTAGTAGSVTVVALDASNNQNRGYTKTVVASSSDAQATLPSNYAFTVTDGGSHTFTNGITLKTAGTQSITFDQSDDGTVDGTQSGITVNAASASVLSVTGIDDPITAGTSDSVVVTAKDAYSNTVTSYTGTVGFTSDDTQAVLPSNYSFVGGDNGTKTFTNGVTLKTAGERTVTATDTVTPSITGNQSAITVNPASASVVLLTDLPNTTTVGEALSPTVTIKDSYGNLVTNYTGTQRFTSSDTNASLPAAYTFVLSDAGVKTFTDGVTLKTSGSRTVTVTDTVNSALNDQETISVSAGQPNKFRITGVTSPIQAGTATSASATVYDAFDNIVTDYTGSVNFSSSDAQATLPTTYTFATSDVGSHLFPNAITFRTVGTQSLTVTDISNSSITGTLGGISVTPVPSATTPPTSGGNNPKVEVVPITLIIINPETGTFSGSITQVVGGQLLSVEVNGVLVGGSITGTVTGTYGDLPVGGSITGTVKNNKITSAQLSLFSSSNSQFSLTVLLGGEIQSSTPVSKKSTENCVMEGNMTTTINGELFTGTVKFSPQDDGSLKGTVKGTLDGKRVNGSFTASSYTTEVIGGTVTLVRQDVVTSPITGELVGTVDPGEIELTSARNCTLNGKISFVTDQPGNSTGSNNGKGKSTVVIPDDPDQDEGTPIEVPVDGTITDPNDSKTEVIVLGTMQTTLGDIVIQPETLSMKTKETRDLANGALLAVSAATTLPVIPFIQNELLTSSLRNFWLPRWLFFGYVPRRRRKFWGKITDKNTGAPVANVLVQLFEAATGQLVKQYRTDKTGRYGFLVGSAGQYVIAVNDPLYLPYRSDSFTVNDPKQSVVTRDIVLDATEAKQERVAKKAQRLLALLAVLGYLHWPVLVFGTGLSLYLAYTEPNAIRALLAGVYLIIWLGKIFGFRRDRHFGQITDEDGQPLDHCVIQLTSKDEGVANHIQSTVTDKLGRFVLLVKPGVYDMIVTKEGYVTRHGAVITDEANMVIKLKRQS